MSNFTNDLIVKSISSTKWELVSEFYYYLDEDNENRGIKVPSGFITDFASTPRLAWSIIPPTGKHTKAAVLHDYLYSDPTCWFICGIELSKFEISRKECDKIFLNAMKVLGVKKWKRTIIYLGVRIGGRKHFKA